MSDRETRLERMIGAVILPEFRPAGGESPGAPERRPSGAYLRRFPPAGLIGFGRRMPDGLRIDGLERLTRELVQSANGASGLAPFVCADLECGAGYHLPGASLLPPARALAAAEAILPGAVEAASELTGREARAAGIDLVLAPVLDVNTNPANPIIGVRSFGRTVDEVTAMGRASIAGLHRAGAGACIKHYPGHGDTCLDSHLTLPTIERSLSELEACELAPFRRVLADAQLRGESGALAVMVAHLDVPALTRQPGLATSLSPAVIERLRADGFDGVVMTDGLAMKAVSDLPDLAVRCLMAGCDGLLAPVGEEAMAEQLLEAVLEGRLPEARLAEAARRMGQLRARLATGIGAPGSGELPKPGLLAGAALAASPDFAAWCEVFSGQPLHLIATADFGPVAQALSAATAAPPAATGPRLVIAGAQNIAGNGASGLGPGDAAKVIQSLEEASSDGAKAGLVWFGAPEGLLGSHLADFHRALQSAGAPTLVAFAPSAVMVDAVGDLLAVPGDKIRLHIS